MLTVLISGAASGLGAAFLAAYGERDDTHIIAVDRAPVSLPACRATAHIVDITSEASVTALAAALGDRPIDLVIHSAGERGLVPQLEDANPHDVAACDALPVMDLVTLVRVFHVNAAGTFLLLRALLPCLRAAPTPKVVVMASRMGSLALNEPSRPTAGGAYAYRASKAAANAIVRSLAVDVPDVVFVLCHPGRVDTNLVRCREDGAVSPEESVHDMLPWIERWGPSDTGSFYDRFGQAIPW